MRIIALLVVAMLLAVPAYALTEQGGPDSRITANTISFNTTGFIVTFNSVCNCVFVSNESTTDSLWIWYRNIGWNADQTFYTMPTVSTAYIASDSTVRILPDSSISIDIKTDKIGFDSAGSGTLSYIATSDRGQP